MTAQENPKRKKRPEKPDREIRVALEKARAEVEQEHHARVKAEQALTEVQEALAAAQAEIEAESIELPPTAPGEEGLEQRISFVVRLTVDEHGQPRRMEVEHVRSGKKENFPNLDVQQLADFMLACINSPPAHP